MNIKKMKERILKDIIICMKKGNLTIDEVAYHFEMTPEGFIKELKKGDYSFYRAVLDYCQELTKVKGRELIK